MTEEQKIPLAPLPELPSEEDARREQMAELKPYLLDATENYPEPIYLLEYNGVPFSTLGGVQALSGQKKNGKTFLLAQLMAAVLGVNSERVKAYLPGLRVPERTLDYWNHLQTVLYVDTEMEKLNSAKVLRRVHWLCGWQMDKPCERFHVLWLRSVTDTKDDKGNVKEKAFQKRYRLIRQAIDILRPDAVFIDGIRDIIGNFNDNEESAALVTELMALAEQRNICIWNTLHMNPRMKNDDESKMRGHLGTELGNKVTDTLVCIKHKNDKTGDVYFTVKQDDARGKDMEDWEFVVTGAAGALGVPQMRAVASEQDITDAKIQQARIEADDIFKLYTWNSSGATYTELEKWLKSKGITSNRRIGGLFDTAMEAGIIYKTNRKYHYAGLNRDVPNDQSEALPFDKPDNDDPDF
jgi:hypothetical protein